MHHHKVPLSTQGEREREHASSLVFLLIRTLILLGWGFTLTTSFNVNYFCLGPISDTATLGAEASTYQ